MSLCIAELEGWRVGYYEKTALGIDGCIQRCALEKRRDDENITAAVCRHDCRAAERIPLFLVEPHRSGSILIRYTDVDT